MAFLPIAPGDTPYCGCDNDRDGKIDGGKMAKFAATADGQITHVYCRSWYLSIQLKGRIKHPPFVLTQPGQAGIEY
jgi:hypothetical protein